MSEKSQVSQIQIICSPLLHVLAGAGFIAASVTEGFVVCTLVDEVSKNKPLRDILGPFSMAAALPVIGAFLVYYYVFRVAIKLELGETLHVQTILKRREVAWSELGRFELLDTDALRKRLKHIMPIEITLTNGSTHTLWASVDDAERALSLVRAKSWAKDWKGAPMGRLAAIAAIVIGIFVFAHCMVMAMLLEQNRLIFLVVGGLGGLFGVGYGIYHGIWRPKYHQASVGRSSENALMGIIR
jgi:hypothetical protein